MSLTAAQAFEAIETRAEAFYTNTLLPAAKGELTQVETSQQLATLKAGLLADLRSAEADAMAAATNAAAKIMTRIGTTQVPAPVVAPAVPAAPAPPAAK